MYLDIPDSGLSRFHRVTIGKASSVVSHVQGVGAVQIIVNRMC